MITLKQLTMRQAWTGETDGELIAEWFKENDMAIEGIDIITKLAKKKIEDDQNMYGMLVGHISMYSATEDLIKNFGIEDGCKLDHIIRTYIMYNALGKDFAEFYPQYIDWLKEFIPKNKRPFMFLRDFSVFLHKHDIYFKDEEKKDE